MNRPFQFKSVRSRMTFWVMLVALVPLLLAIALVSRQRATFLRQDAWDNLATIRDLKVAQIERWLDERLDNVDLLAATQRLRDFLSANGTVTTPSPAVTAAARRFLQRYQTIFADCNEAFLVSAASGRILVSSNLASEGRDESQSPYFTEPLRTGRIFIRDIYFSPVMHGPAMAFAAPVRSSASEGAGSVLGILVLRMDLQHSLYPLLLDRTGLGATGETLIVNSNGLALNQLRWQPDAPLHLTIHAEPARRGAAGETGVVESHDYREVSVLAAFSHLPRTGWGFVAKKDLDELNAPIRAMQLQLLLVMAGALGLVLVSVIPLSRTISQPLRDLRDTARNMARGNTEVRSQLERTDELGALARAFNAMAGRLGTQLRTTAALAEINATMVASAGPGEFLEALLQKVVKLTDSCLGVAYRFEETNQRFTALVSIGASTEALAPFDATIREGELGRVLTTEQISHRRSLPEDTVFTFRTVAGTVRPRELVSVPLVVDGRVEAILALASLHPCPRWVINVLENAQHPMNSGLAHRLAVEQTEALSHTLSDRNEELEIQARQLTTQAEELRSQADELSQQNLELEFERRRVNEANRLKSEFLANMSHELRTPLNSVLALSGVLQSQAGDRLSDEEHHYLAIIERNGQNLLRMINDILDLARIEAGGMELSPRRFSSRASLETLVEQLAPLALQRKLSLELELPDDLPEIETDEARWQQVLQNLLSNAIKFTEQGGVTVSATVREDRIHVAVTDTGSGIPEDELETIFEEFRQVNGTSAREQPGTGLGLAIARRTARLLGGDVTVSSRVGEGSVFTFTLPLTSPTPPSDPSDPSDRLHPTPHLLLVEDNEAAVIQVRHVLDQAGYRVTVARSGPEALEQVRDFTPDGIILDLMMPEMDGLETLCHIRALPHLASVPVLVLTAKTLTAEDLKVLRGNRVKQLIQKGEVNLEALLASIRTLLGQTPSRPAPAPAPPRRRPPTILVIEDNPDNLTTVRAILGDQYQVLEATSGQAGLQRLEADRPDLVLLDISLPGMDGYEVVQRIRAHPELRALPVIALTALAMKGDRDRILAAGCDDCLTKPVEPKTLLHLLKAWLNPGSPSV